MRRRSLLLGLSGGWLAGQEPAWQTMFDGKSLGQWKPAPFRDAGAVRVDNQAIVLAAGRPMTGVTYQGPFPKEDYEIRCEAARLEGGDFFASLTFPVGDSFCTFVTGGWGGDIVGLSSIDGWDASDNETRTYFNFETGRWYRLRLQVTRERIQGWIDDERVLDVRIAGREISLRVGDTKLTAPLGFMSYGTTGGIRKIEYRPLKPSR
jgi:hypothetical protein